MTASSPRTQASNPTTSASPRVRFDELAILVRRVDAAGTRFEIRPSRLLTAAQKPVLPLFEGWLAGGELVVQASGPCNAGYTASLDIDGDRPGPSVPADVVQSASGHLHGSFELVVPLRSLASHLDAEVRMGVAIGPGDRVVHLLRATFVRVAARGPRHEQLRLEDSTNTLLFDAAPRPLFDLQNPEEGFWAGTGKWRLCLTAEWGDDAAAYTIGPRPTRVRHRWLRTGDPTDLLHEDTSRRAGRAPAEADTARRKKSDTLVPSMEHPGPSTHAELVFDTSHAELGDVPPEGRDVPLDLSFEHDLSFGAHRCLLEWHAPLPLRVRDPRPLLNTFARLSAVGIDFGTTSTVAAYYHKGFRALLRIGSESVQSTFENPTYLLIEDHARLWEELSRGGERRFPDLMRVVRAGAAAHHELPAFPNAVVGELKSLPERVMVLDESPQLRDRQRQSDFLLDEQRVRALIRTYAYLLGRAINLPGQDIFLNYWLTHPAKLDKRTRLLLEDELRAGILLSIPEGVPAEEVRVAMRASEPEAFAAEVCPELAAAPALEPLVARFGELRFAVFDFGGSTLDIACGRFRPATEAELGESSAATVIETLQVGGDDRLGGDYLTHELVWLTHQHEAHLPEMLDKEVPMMRPQTVPANTLADKPHLYKRSLAGRQNMVRFARELALEQVKFARANQPALPATLTAARLDGGEVELTSLGTDGPALTERLQGHLADRIRDGVRLLGSVLRSTRWGDEGESWREQGVVLLLAGNGSRAELVETVLGEELGVDGLKVWRPGSDGAFDQVVLYDTPPRRERGVTIPGVTPKTAVALGALRIANREVHLVRQAQGFSYFVGDLRGFPPKYQALIAMGTLAADPNEQGDHYVDFGSWDGQKPLRICKDYEEGRMTANDPRLTIVPTGLPREASGRLRVCVTAPEELALVLERPGEEPATALLNLARFID